VTIKLLDVMSNVVILKRGFASHMADTKFICEFLFMWLDDDENEIHSWYDT
jgi:hypothetical protein